MLKIYPVAAGKSLSAACAWPKASVNEAMCATLAEARRFESTASIEQMSAVSNSTLSRLPNRRGRLRQVDAPVIRDLAEGSSRFCELERSLEGISPRTLSLRLRALEEEGIVERHTFPRSRPGSSTR